MSLKDLIDKYPLVAIEIASIDRRNSIAKLKASGGRVTSKSLFLVGDGRGLHPSLEVARRGER